MSNIATALKTEISRIARKEIKAEKYRSDIAKLKRQVAALQKELFRAMLVQMVRYNLLYHWFIGLNNLAKAPLLFAV